MKYKTSPGGQDAMFEALKAVIASLKQKAESTGATIFYDRVPCLPDHIVVDDTGIYIRFNEYGDMLYEHTPAWDHGWYDPQEQNIARIKGHFKLYKEIPY